MEQEFIFGVLNKTKIIHTEYPSGQEESVTEITNDTRGGKVYPRRTTTKFDKKGKPKERTIYRIGPNGKYITVKEKRQGNRWVPVSKNKQTSQSSRGYDSSTTVDSGLQTTTFDTPKGNIVFNVADDISAGSSLSGTVYVNPKGRDDEERKANAAALGKHSIEFGNQSISTASLKYDPFKMTLANSSIGLRPLVLKDRKGKEVARTVVYVSHPIVSEIASEFNLPEIGQEGGSIRIGGKFDGDSANTGVKIGDTKLPIVAESPTTTVAYNGSSKLGLGRIEVTENGASESGDFRNLGIRLSAPKLDLLRGEQTTLTVKVFGLAGIEKPVPLILQNESPLVISMARGNRQNLLINPSEVENGVYTTTRGLTGVKRGSFTITGTVTVDAPNMNINNEVIAASRKCNLTCTKKIIAITNSQRTGSRFKHFRYRRVRISIYELDENGKFGSDPPIVFDPRKTEFVADEVKDLVNEIEKTIGSTVRELINAQKEGGSGLSEHSSGCMGNCKCVLPKDPNGNDFPAKSKRRSKPGEKVLSTTIDRIVELPSGGKFLISYLIEFNGTLEEYAGICQDTI